MAIVIDHHRLSDEESFDKDNAETEDRAFAAEAQRIKSNLLQQNLASNTKRLTRHLYTEKLKIEDFPVKMIYSYILISYRHYTSHLRYGVHIKRKLVEVEIADDIKRKNTLSGIPKIIAQQLNLPDPDSYTGHCFRRSSATILSNTGANLNMVKKHGGWSSDTVAQGYLAFSIAERTEIFNKMTGPSSTQIQPPLRSNNMKKTSSEQPKIYASSQEKPSTSEYNLKKKPSCVICNPHISSKAAS
ncbi:hypothetical protein TKK_0001293 [Trichogramma kaykai]